MPSGSVEIQGDPAEHPTLDGIVSGDGRGRRTFNRLIWTVAGVAIVAVLGMIFAPLLTRVPLAHLAQRYVTLPSDAKVRSVIEGKVGEATIEFTLPEPLGPGSRIAEIAADAGFPAPVTPARPVKGAKKGGFVVSKMYGGWQTVVSGDAKIGLTYQFKRGYLGESDTLSYKPALKIYRYSVVKEEPSY